jgi:hypothetical protein
MNTSDQHFKLGGFVDRAIKSLEAQPEYDDVTERLTEEGKKSAKIAARNLCRLAFEFCEANLDRRFLDSFTAPHVHSVAADLLGLAYMAWPGEWAIQVRLSIQERMKARSAHGDLLNSLEKYFSGSAASRTEVRAAVVAICNEVLKETSVEAEPPQTSGAEVVTEPPIETRESLDGVPVRPPAAPKHGPPIGPGPQAEQEAKANYNSRHPCQPGRDRQSDIIAAIRAAGVPLQRPEFIPAMKLKTEGKLGGNLAWMVKNGILINIPNRGYWPAGDPIPQ